MNIKMNFKRVISPPLLTLMLSSPSYADITTEKSGDKLMMWMNYGALASTLFYENGWSGTKEYTFTTVVSQTITEGIKGVVDKTRPNGNCCNSFPSGHATGSFSAAAFLHFRYENNYVTIPAYLGASYVALSRVEADKHYVEDVIAGAAIGIGSAYFFNHLFKSNYTSITVPIVTKNFVGINFLAEW